jgi:hypothetical protein
MEKEYNQWSTLWASSFKWQTSIAKEDLYKDGVASANYQGFNRRNPPSWSKIQDGYWTKTQDSLYRKKLPAKTQKKIVAVDPEIDYQ